MVISLHKEFTVYASLARSIQGNSRNKLRHNNQHSIHTSSNCFFVEFTSFSIVSLHFITVHWISFEKTFRCQICDTKKQFQCIFNRFAYRFSFLSLYFATKCQQCVWTVFMNVSVFLGWVVFLKKSSVSSKRQKLCSRHLWNGKHKRKTVLNQ